VFIGVTGGWLSPRRAPATAEDIATHLDDMEELSDFAVPGSVWDELREIGRAYARRDGSEEVADA
jgi:hypothetical protein